jgi:hypothetical protein
MPLATPPPGEIQHLGGHVRDREDARQLAHPHRLRALIPHDIAQHHHARLMDLQLRNHVEGQTLNRARFGTLRVRPLVCGAASPALGS